MEQNRKDYWQQYYQTNRKKLLEDKRQYYQVNREVLLDKRRQYREANRELLLERNRQYRQDNREVLMDKKRLNRLALKMKLAGGSMPILRQYERRDCKKYRECWNKAALEDLRQVPCHYCSSGGMWVSGVLCGS